MLSIRLGVAFTLNVNVKMVMVTELGAAACCSTVVTAALSLRMADGTRDLWLACLGVGLSDDSQAPSSVRRVAYINPASHI